MRTTADSPALLRWTRFTDNPIGTGGEKRSAQIRALVEAAGFVVADMHPPPSVPRARAWWAGLRWRLRLGRHASVDGAGPGLLGYRAVFYREALARHPGPRLLLWETTYDTVLPCLARAAGFRIIALPHNLEAFVSEAAFADPRHQVLTDLAAEVDRLGRADVIFTIAKEERWLLQSRGLEPHYLPFFPDPVLAADCAAIRAQRASRARADGTVPGPLLLLGSAFNPATARGMQLQLAWLRQGGLPPAGAVVVGPQTERVLAAVAFPGVQLRGGLTQPALRELLESCSALLIHTVGGAGAVTRIPEALLAGIPVIANTNAARDQHGRPGVHVYDDPAEFCRLAAQPLPQPPSPTPPVAEERRFQSTLRAMAASQTPQR